MFRATMCPSSGENTVPIRHLVFVTLYGWLSGMQGGVKHVEKNNKQIKKNCAPSWFFFTRLYKNARSTEHKTRVGIYFSGIHYLRLSVHKGVLFPDSDTEVLGSCAGRTKDLLAGGSSLALIFSTSSASSCSECYLLSKVEALARSPLHLFVVSLCGKLFVRKLFCLNMWRNMFCQVYFSYVSNINSRNTCKWVTGTTWLRR
jgi:hypothetical protein